jgi:membrane protein
LLASILIEAVLSGFRHLLVKIFSDYTIYLIEVASSVTNIAIVTLVFALVFKLLPDARIRWKDVWVGSIVTTILFVIGKNLIGIYLSSSNFSSTYGAAGSLVIILLWIYYSAVIFLIGAEFTKAYSQRVGKAIRPKKNAVKVEKREIEREVKQEESS